MWEESVNVSAQAKGSWAMTEKPQGSVLTQHLCCYSGSHGASSRGSSWTERWTQMLRQEAGGHRRRKRWVSCSEASALYIGSCRNALRRLKCKKKKKSICFDWSSSKPTLTYIMLKEMSYWGQQNKKPVSFWGRVVSQRTTVTIHFPQGWVASEQGYLLRTFHWQM